MPEDFDRCVREGGRVRTKKLSGDRYMRICWDKAGKSHAGEVKSKIDDMSPEEKIRHGLKHPAKKG